MSFSRKIIAGLKKSIVILQRENENLRLRNAQLLQENNILQKKTIYDSLTGLYSRQYGLEWLAEQCALAGRGESVSALSVIMLDIDNFKAINDNYNHLIGDTVLKTVAQAVKSVFLRQSDMVCRWGGEEFIVVLPNTSFSAACCLAEEIRLVVNQTPITFFNRQQQVVLYKTVSLGVAEYTPTMTCDSLVEMADRRMLLAKQNGRNQVFTAPDELMVVPQRK